MPIELPQERGYELVAWAYFAGKAPNTHRRMVNSISKILKVLTEPHAVTEMVKEYSNELVEHIDGHCRRNSTKLIETFLEHFKPIQCSGWN